MSPKDTIYEFLIQQKLAVISSINAKDKPESALVGIAVSANFEIIFDTINTSRKYQNILDHPNVAVLIGWDDEVTLQYEGQAEILGNDNEALILKEIYFIAYPDGRGRAETWPGLVHIKISPKWMRYSNFNEPQLITELIF